MYLFSFKMTCFPRTLVISTFQSLLKKWYIKQKRKPIFVKVFIVPHHQPHQQSPVWSVWEVIFWLNESHTILHTGSHGRSFDAHFSALWSLRFLSSERGVDGSCVEQDPPELFVPVFIWGGSACLHHILESRTAGNCNQCTLGTPSKL